MFKLAVSAAYFTPVTVEIPIDGGKTQKVVFDAQFKRLTQPEMDALGDRLKTGDISDRALIDEVLVGWKGVQDENGEELEFSPTNLDALLAVHPTRPSIAKAFLASLSGAKQKN